MIPQCIRQSIWDNFTISLPTLGSLCELRVGESSKNWRWLQVGERFWFTQTNLSLGCLSRVGTSRKLVGVLALFGMHLLADILGLVFMAQTILRHTQTSWCQHISHKSYAWHKELEQRICFFWMLQQVAKEVINAPRVSCVSLGMPTSAGYLTPHTFIFLRRNWAFRKF